MLIRAQYAALVDLQRADGTVTIEDAMKLVEEMFLPLEQQRGIANRRAMAAMGLDPAAGRTVGVHVKKQKGRR